MKIQVTIPLVLLAAQTLAERSVRDNGTVVALPDDVLVASAPALDETFPSDLTPIFRMDATQRANWTFEADGVTVKKIPSLVGTRYLTTDPDDITTWGRWNGDKTPTGPLLVEATELRGYALDFGALGSMRGLFFSPNDIAGATIHSNQLDGVGTVFLVFNSEASGGWMLGGGWTTTTGANGGASSGLAFGRSNITTATDPAYTYASVMLAANGDYAGDRSAIVYQDSFGAGPRMVGFNGGWEVLAFEPQKAEWATLGLGMGDPRTWGASYRASGGQKVAEFIVFGTVLPADARKRVEAYLAKKWFGRVQVGNAGVSRVGSLRLTRSGGSPGNMSADPVNVTVTVAEGKSLGVDSLRGGRNNGTLTVNGGGELSLADSSGYGGSVTLASGKLSFARRALPTSLPARGLRLHLDAADVMTETTSDGTFLTRWTSQATEFSDVYSGVPISAAVRPTVVSEPILGGKTVVDFGKMASGRVLSLVTDDDSAVTVSGICTVLAVIGAQEGGGQVFGVEEASYADYLRRDVSADLSRGYQKTAILKTSGTITRGQATSVRVDATALVLANGVHADTTDALQTAGYQVLAINVPGASVNAIGGLKDGTVSGGMRIAELAVYKRVLTREELSDAGAYLWHKWTGRSLPGYALTNETIRPDLVSVSSTGDLTVSVEGGCARIDSISVPSGTLVKNGSGILELVDGTGADGIAATVSSGVLRVSAKDAGADDLPATGAAFHLDARRTDRMYVEEVGGKKFVRGWYDLDDPSLCAYNNSANSSPELLVADVVASVKANVLDFDVTGSGRQMSFSRPFDAIRTAFVVTRLANGSTILGATGVADPASGGTTLDFERHADGQGLIIANGTSACNGCPFYVDGVLTKTNVALDPDDYHVYEIIPSRPACASALCQNRNGKMSGGQQLCEVILYERVLTERERIVTRNYLMKKWLGKTGDELSPVPAAVMPSVKFSTVAVSGTGALAVAPGAVLNADSVTYADGAVLPVAVDAQGRASTLDVSGAVSFAGKVTVALETPLDYNDLPSKLLVLSAGSLVNPGALTEAPVTFNGQPSELFVKVFGNSVFLSKPRGLLLLVR